MKTQEIKATYTIGKETKEVLFTKEEVIRYGLKKVIWFHARKLKLSKYSCNVMFPEKERAEAAEQEAKPEAHKYKVFHNPLNRLIHRITRKEIMHLMDIKMALNNNLSHAA